MRWSTDSNIERKSLNNAYLNIIKIIKLLLVIFTNERKTGLFRLKDFFWGFLLGAFPFLLRYNSMNWSGNPISPQTYPDS